MFNPNFYVESFTISLGEVEGKKPKKIKNKESEKIGTRNFAWPIPLGHLGCNFI